MEAQEIKDGLDTITIKYCGNTIALTLQEALSLRNTLNMLFGDSKQGNALINQDTERAMKKLFDRCTI